MTLVVQVEADLCAGNIAGPHLWHFFEGGRGCYLCPAWVPYVSRQETVDPLPTRFPAFHTSDPLYLSYGPDVPEPEPVPDVDVEVMNLLLPVLALNVGWREAQAVASSIVALVRARD